MLEDRIHVLILIRKIVNGMMNVFGLTKVVKIMIGMMIVIRI